MECGLLVWSAKNDSFIFELLGLWDDCFEAMRRFFFQKVPSLQV